MIVECATCHSRYSLTDHEPGQEVFCRCGATIRVPEHPSTAKTLNCPQCGASCSPEQIKCVFCGASLAVVPCPRCFDLLFAGTRHCPNCGADCTRPALTARDGAASPRVCPRCGAKKKDTKLTARIAGETLLDQCADCGGVWMDMHNFDQVLSDARRHTALRALGLETRAEGGAPATTLPIAYLKCPECGKLMHRKNFGKRSGIIIDTCKDHGVWFDRGELAGVLNFVSSGGLELAQKKELEALKEEVARRKAGTQPPSWQQVTAHDPRFGRRPEVGGAVIEFVISALHRLFRGV